MRRIADYVGQEIRWTQPHALRRHFELRSGEDVIATLGFRSAFGSLATAESADGRWTFKRVGFWRSHVTVRELDRDTNLAVFRNDTWTAGGSVELADGRHLRANSNFWLTSYQFVDPQEQPIVRFTRVGGVIHMSCDVTIEPAGAREQGLPWLVALGWYLTIKMHDDAAGSSAAAAGAAG